MYVNEKRPLRHVGRFYDRSSVTPEIVTHGVAVTAFINEMIRRIRTKKYPCIAILWQDICRVFYAAYFMVCKSVSPTLQYTVPCCYYMLNVNQNPDNKHCIVRSWVDLKLGFVFCNITLYFKYKPSDTALFSVRVLNLFTYCRVINGALVCWSTSMHQWRLKYLPLAAKHSNYAFIWTNKQVCGRQRDAQSMRTHKKADRESMNMQVMSMRFP